MKNTEKEIIFDFHGVSCRLTYTDNHAWRLQTMREGSFASDGAGQILALDLGEEPSRTERPILIDGSVLSGADGSKILLENGSLIVRTPSGRNAICLTGMKEREDSVSVEGVFSADERIYGTGERFDCLNRRGRTTEIFAADRWLAWEGNSYVPIPLLVSSEGHGLFVNRFERCLFDLDSHGDGRYELRVMGKVPMDLYLFASDRMQDVLYGYSVLTGFSPEPAEWMYGTQVCRYAPDFCTS